jgi:hypothetical protein
VRTLLIVCLAGLTGCYSYAPAAGRELPRGTPVRARLSTPTDFRLTDLSVNNTVLLDGEVIRQDPDSLVLSAFSLRANTGYTLPAIGETVSIPTDRIAGIERRRFDALRSGLLVAAAAVGSALFFSALNSGGGGGSSGGGTPNPQ